MTYISYPDYDHIRSVTASNCVQLAYRLTGSQMILLLSLPWQYFHCGTVLVWLQITVKHQGNDTCLLI